MYYNEVEEVKDILRTSEYGLSKEEAAIRLDTNGRNEIPKKKKTTIMHLFISQFMSPIVFILVIAAVFSIITKSYSDSVFIFIVIFINAIIGTYQEWNSERSAEKLQNMIRTQSKVFRSGKQIEINSSELVIGDFVTLESGDKVTADIRLVKTNNLEIDEAILTGESIAKEKINNVIAKDTVLSERNNMAYAGGNRKKEFIRIFYRY